MALQIENVSIAEKCILVHYKKPEQEMATRIFLF